jgi:uncharacterized membrane protein
MNGRVVVEFVNLFLAGLLAGEEFIVRFGVRGPLAALDDKAHIEMRQALIMKLRVLVPAIFIPTLLSGLILTALDGTHPGFALRCAGVLALLIWLLVTLTGTVPINEAALRWQPETPPTNWTMLVERWERLDTVRAVAAVAAFGCFLATVALRFVGA